jgi:hypothetical protein
MDCVVNAKVPPELDVDNLYLTQDSLDVGHLTVPININLSCWCREHNNAIHLCLLQ